MVSKQLTWTTGFLCIALSLIVGCSPSGTPPASTTSITSSPIPESSPTPHQLPIGPGAEWDLVVIGDSSMWKLANAYAAQIEKDVGVKVLPHDVTIGDLEAGKVLRSLQTGEVLHSLPDTLREAEVVVMFVNPMLSIDPENPHDFVACFGSKEPGPCSIDTFEIYIDDIKAIWAEIIELRAGQLTILRATDLYNPLVTNWEKRGVFEACTQCWMNLSEANRIAAEAYNIPFLSRLEAFGGPDFKENPREKGFIANDGEHPTELMGQYTAELLAQLGYEPVSLP